MRRGDELNASANRLVTGGRSEGLRVATAIGPVGRRRLWRSLRLRRRRANLRLLAIDILAGEGVEFVPRHGAVAVDDAEIVLRMLIVVLGRDAIARGMSVARERQIFLVELIGVAAQLAVGAAAVQGLQS